MNQAKKKLQTDFANLAAGDLISAAGMEGELLVLRTKPTGEILLGTMCRFGADHVHPVEFYVKWDERAEGPVTPDGEIIFRDWEKIADKVSVIKEANPKLAAQYFDTPVRSDYVNDEIKKSAEKAFGKEALDRVGYINSFSEAGDAIKTVAMLRTLGVKITEEQAYVAIAAAEMNEDLRKAAGSLGSLLNVLGNTLSHMRR